MPKSPTRPTQYPSPQWARELQRGKPRHSCRGGRPPAHAEALPVAMGGKVLVHPPRETHPLHLFQQQRNVVDTLRDNVLYLIHAQSLTQSGVYLQICANGKYPIEQIVISILAIML